MSIRNILLTTILLSLSGTAYSEETPLRYYTRTYSTIKKIPANSPDWLFISGNANYTVFTFLQIKGIHWLDDETTTLYRTYNFNSDLITEEKIIFRRKSREQRTLRADVYQNVDGRLISDNPVLDGAPWIRNSASSPMEKFFKLWDDTHSKQSTKDGTSDKQ